MGKTTRRRGAAKLAGSERRASASASIGAFARSASPSRNSPYRSSRKRGGGILVRLKAEWAAIVGPDWAEVTWPAALGRDGVLKLRAAPGAALELQHRAPLLIERINLFFGRAVVTRLALVQGPLPLAPAPAGPSSRRCRRARRRRSIERLSEIADPELRAALARLGRAVSGGQTLSRPLHRLPYHQHMVVRSPIMQKIWFALLAVFERHPGFAGAGAGCRSAPDARRCADCAGAHQG